MTKRAEIEKAIASGVDVYLSIDARRPGVWVPEYLMNVPNLTLVVGLNLRIMIQDLELKADMLVGTLSFSDSLFYCEIPLSSIWGMRAGADNLPMIWYDAMPDEIVSNMLRNAKAVARRELPPNWSVIKGGKAN